MDNDPPPQPGSPPPSTPPERPLSADPGPPEPPTQPGVGPSTSASPPPPVAADLAGTGPVPGPGGQAAPATPAGGPAGPAGPAHGWYSGPLPIADLAPRESMGSAIGRTAVKALTVLIILGAGLILIPILFVAVIAGLAGAGGAGAEGLPTPRAFVSGERNADVHLVAVPISGLILGEEPDNAAGLFAPISITYGYRIQEELAELADDENVDGVILEINSPGGTIFGSRAIADGIDAYREETGKPIYAFVSGISASGGVYSMAGADQIYADYGTQIGSIGVILGPITTYDDVRAIDGGLLGGGVTTEGGVTVEYFTAGRNKDFGNPYRPVTDEEREVIQAGLDDAYADFVAHVSAGRDIPEADIENGLGANIFGDSQAVANGLIDGVSNRDATYELVAEAAGLEDGQTWRVDRIQTTATGLLGALAGPVDALTGAEPSVRGTQGPISATAQICSSRGVMLAYHGDPTLLCAGTG